MDRINRYVSAILIVLLLALPVAGQAQERSRTFPETGHAVSGRFLQFWEQNGGLAVFGYPLSERQQENGRAVQYFERQRFELHPENQPPYDVLLGRLGDEVLQQRGIDWRTQPVSPAPAAGCLYFEQTRHNVCNQQPGVGFLSYWTTHGIEFDRRSGKSYAESLALFGYPITELYTYTTSSGQSFQAQWFERARFEWHPENPSPYKVLLGRLGAELIEGRGPGTVDRVNLYFIALEDNGRSGKKIGCNDSVVPVEIQIVPTRAPLTAALEQLFAVHSQYYGESGLYNALYQSSLHVDSAAVQQGRATIYLSGTFQLGGVCDDPRFAAQIEETALQFPTVGEVVVFINGRRLEDILSEK